MSYVDVVQLYYTQELTVSICEDYDCNYRYGFNGMEKDDEVKSGKGNTYTTHYRKFDPRLARWLSLDPVMHHHFSPYITFDDNPIYYKDPTGADGDPPTSIKGGGTKTNVYWNIMLVERPSKVSFIDGSLKIPTEWTNGQRGNIIMVGGEPTPVEGDDLDKNHYVAKRAALWLMAHPNAELILVGPPDGLTKKEIRQDNKTAEEFIGDFGDPNRKGGFSQSTRTQLAVGRIDIVKKAIEKNLSRSDRVRIKVEENPEREYTGSNVDIKENSK